MNDPDDKTLLEFVSRFAGWENPRFISKGVWEGTPPGGGFSGAHVPDYLNDLNAWHRDVAPRIEADERLADEVQTQLWAMIPYRNKIINADARYRCLALYRALEGKLP